MDAVLDIRTLVLTYVGLTIGQAVVLVYLWSVQRSYPPAKDWAVGSLMFAIGLFLFALRTQASVVLTEIVSNLFLLPGLMLFNFGIVKATGRTPPMKSGLAFCLVAIAFIAWFVLVSPNYPARVVIHNLVFLTLYF